MIVNLFLGALKAVLVFFMGLMPHLGVPSWLSSATSALGTVTAGLSSTTGFLPWSVIAGAVVLAIAGVGLSVAIRGVRIALSFLTLGGGS
jgi:hypothetical protein